MNAKSLNETKEQRAAEQVVRKYMELLQTGDTDGIMKMYSDDSVFLPMDAPTVAGKDKIRESYSANFKIMSIKDSESTLEENSVYSDLAIVRLSTKSTIVILATKEEFKTNAREFFVLKKVDDSFKISRYMFNKF